MQLHREINSAVFHLNTQNNYWLYIEWAELHMVVCQMKILRIPATADRRHEGKIFWAQQQQDLSELIFLHSFVNIKLIL
jgi:hypothetical protein